MNNFSHSLLLLQKHVLDLLLITVRHVVHSAAGPFVAQCWSTVLGSVVV